MITDRMGSGGAAAERETGTLAGLANGLAVIEAFDVDRQKLSISDVARLVGLERATARRCLLTLTSLGFADHDGKFFSLTPRILRLGHAYLSSTPLPKIVQPYLEQLSGQTGESCSVSILDGTEIIYVARAAQPRVITISLNVGSRLPAYCASMGRVLLAALPDDEARRILEASDRRALTPRTRIRLVDLIAELGRVRRQGYAVNDEELELGLRSIAIPVLACNGRVLAALNVGVQAARISIDCMTQDVLPRMLAVQAELQRLLA